MADPTNKPDEFAASDILAPGVWTAKTARPAVGIDVACTKIVVDLQTMPQAHAELTLQQALSTLRASADVDSAFLLLLAGDGQTIQTVYASHSSLMQGRVETLRDESLARYPWLSGRLDHLRLSELRDCANPRVEQQAEARRFLELQIGSALTVALRVQGKPAGLLGLATTLPRGAWDVNLQLLLKLIGTSLASGARAHCARDAARRAWRSAVEMSQLAANDGLWDFDVQTNAAYFLAALEGDAGLRRTRRRSSRRTGAVWCTRRTCRGCSADARAPRGQADDVRERAPHASSRRRVALGA